MGESTRLALLTSCLIGPRGCIPEGFYLPSCILPSFTTLTGWRSRVLWWVSKRAREVAVEERARTSTLRRALGRWTRTFK